MSCNTGGKDEHVMKIHWSYFIQYFVNLHNIIVWHLRRSVREYFEIDKSVQEEMYLEWSLSRCLVCFAAVGAHTSCVLSM